MESTVVYIIGDNRSGSTLLDYLLSFYNNSCSLGELHQLNNYFNKDGIGIERNWECSCNKQVDKCVFWSKILDEVSFSKSFKTRFNFAESNWSLVSRNVHAANIKKALNKRDALLKGKNFAQNTWDLYHAVFKHSGKHLIIDSSKTASEAFFLNKYRRGNIKFIILEREIAAVAYSKLKRTIENSDIYNIKAKSISQYIVGSYKILRRNRIIGEFIERGSEHTVVKRIKYHNLANSPKDTIDEISSFLGIQKFDIPTETNRQQKELHVLSGSPSRHSRAPIRVDQRWKSYYKNKPVPRLLAKYLDV